MIDYQAADSFGVPQRIFGNHKEDFYAGIGRIALLASLLEHHVRLLAKKLAAPDPKGKPQTSIDSVIKHARKGLCRIDEHTQREKIAGFLSEAKRLVARRNFYLHSIWPAQADGTLFAWKAEPWETSERTSKEALQQDIAAFVELNDRWKQVWPLVSGRPDAGAEATS
jgi:hypothetical protein